MKKYLTTDEAAQLLRIKRQTLYKWICERKISSLSLGGKTLFDEAELIEWMNTKRREAL